MPVNPSDPSLRSFIEARPDSDFPIQNLPFGVFSTQSSPQKRVGVAIGDFVLDLAELEQRRLLAPAGGETHVFDRASINAYMALGQKVWSQTRAKISELLRHDNPTLRDDKALRETVLVPRSGATMHLPIEVMGFTDQGAYLFDTTTPGNANSGHDYGTDLSPNEKRDLIEYLKTL